MNEESLCLRVAAPFSREGFYPRQIREMYMKGGIEFSSLKTRHDGCGSCRGGGYCHRRLHRFGHVSQRESIYLDLMFELYYRLLI
jgi:hypothetical protein